MAFPWAESTPASNVDTLATSAINGVSTHLPQLINDGGEKVIQLLANEGRIFLVPDGDRFTHPLLHTDGGSSTVRYRRDNFGAGETLSTTSKEILTSAKFDIMFRSRNLPFPQDMPLNGGGVSYMNSLMWGNALGMLKEIESELLLGNATADGTAPAANAPYEGDTDYSGSDLSMSMLSLLSSGTGLVTGRPTSESFAGIKGSDASNWIPQLFNATNADGSTIVEDMDDNARSNWFGPLESTTHGFLGLTLFNKMVDIIRTTGTHNAGMRSNLGKEEDGKVQIGSVIWDWHRFLDTKDAEWDFSANTTPEYPVFMLNLNSLRLNIVAAGTVSDAGPAAQKNPAIGFLKQLPGTFPVPTSTNLFKRVSMGHGFSLENGRRGFAHVEGYTG